MSQIAPLPNLFEFFKLNKTFGILFFFNSILTFANLLISTFPH